MSCFRYELGLAILNLACGVNGIVGVGRRWEGGGAVVGENERQSMVVDW